MPMSEAPPPGRRPESHDRIRTRYLEGRGFRVLRFWDDDVFHEIESVIDTIFAAMEGR